MFGDHFSRSYLSIPINDTQGPSAYSTKPVSGSNRPTVIGVWAQNGYAQLTVVVKQLMVPKVNRSSAIKYILAFNQ